MTRIEKPITTNKKDVRIQLFITEKMDDKITDISELMGMSKQEFVRTAITDYLMRWNASINLASGVMETNPEMKKVLDRLKGVE